ncbi:MAG TPA: zinc ABC transporter substrate-binding protein [Bacillota bacterium]|nr:zinc ABC transporter substrate-binding protein [Bacillota bacterium]
MKLRGIRILAGLIVLLLLTVITGCGSQAASKAGKAREADSQKELVIAASFYPMYIMTLNIAGNIPGVRVVQMSPNQSGCLHDYQFTPSDMTTLEDARIFVINGAGMEAFMEKALSGQPELKVVEASQGLSLIKNASDGQPNPHVWVGISGAIQEVRNISAQLAKVDPAHAQQYSANAAAYVKKLEALRQRMHQSLDGIKNRDIVTFHEAFPYFAREFNLKVVAVVEREPGSQPSAGELAATISLVRASKVKALFAEAQYPAKAAETIARETGARLYVLDPGVTGSPDADAYLNTMNNNLKVLEEALK